MDKRETRWENHRALQQRKEMRQLNDTYFSGMVGYLMDFGFGGFIGYGKGVPVGLVMEELNISMRYY